MSLPVLLRPHHGLCLPRFQGYGYNFAFTRRMTLLSERFGRDPRQTIRLICGTDELCAVCPNRGNSRCKPEFIARLDQICIERCRLHDGDVLAWEQYRDRLAYFLPDVSVVCAECEWRELCVRAQNRLRLSNKERKKK